MKTNNNFHILIVDDEQLNIEIAGAYLKEEGYKVYFSLGAQKALHSLSKHPIDLILLDINMPDMDGFTMASLLKSETKTQDIPIIFLTAQTDISYISKAFEVGGADYITKPFHALELKARVKTQLATLDALREVQHKQEKLAQLSITDSLSKLYNSLYFDSKIKIFQKEQKDFWIIYFKINHFEKLNQLYGFYGANKIIRLFAKLLLPYNCDGSFASRLYGGSFALLIKDSQTKEIENIYKQFFNAFNANKELSKAIGVTTLLYNVPANTEIQTMYKNIFAKIEEMQNSREKVALIR